MAECVICLQLFSDNEKFTILTQNMCDGIVKANANRSKIITPSIRDKVHENCRKKYLNGTDDPKEAPQNAVNEQQNEFKFDSNCLFCGNSCKVKPKSKDAYSVKKPDFREGIVDIINKRKDEWAEEVFLRIENELNLNAVQAVYHQQCNVNFKTYRKKPNSISSAKKGAPINLQLQDSFLKLTQFIEICDEPYATSDLIDKFKEFSGGEVYTVRYLKEKLIQHFGDRLIFVSRNGLSDIVVMKATSDRIIIKSYEEKRKVSEYVNKTMETAASIVLTEIEAIGNNKDTYPLPSEISSEYYGLSFLPQSLVKFLQHLLAKKLTDVTKIIISIGHAIIQACRPRSLLSPIQFGLGVQIHFLTKSRFLVDLLHSMGFSCAYAEVTNFLKCASISNHAIEQSYSPNTVTKYVADNVDHNSCTLDGKGTFHGMGMISIESLNRYATEKRVPRIKATIEDVKKLTNVDIIYYSEDAEETLSVKYKKLRQTVINDTYSKLDLLWTLSWPTVTDRPAWSGFMQLVSTGSYETKPTITYLSMIDLSSSSYTCIYSTMMFVAKQAQQNKTELALTFDQPLWWKARLIIEREPMQSPIKNIVLMLGGFHMKMSYLGSIGHLMTGSGLQELLEQIYAPNSVIKMINGKAIARSIRAHLLVYAALNAIISEELIQESDKPKIAKLFNNVMTNEIGIQDLENNSDLVKMKDKLLEAKSKLKLQGPTSSLWLQYIEMIDILKSNIRGDRIGDFQLHLETTRAMLPYYPASGHNAYTKSVYVYLQDMQNLKNSNPKIYEHFTNGNFVTRRTNRFWAGLPDDLIIEQVLMRNLKSSGGLTRGSGFGENQRALWLKSMPSCGAINNAMQSFTNTALETSEQHKEMGLTRRKRDIQDTQIVYNYLSERNVFANIPGLRNIVDGVLSNSNCNPYDAERVGTAVISKMEGKEASEFVFKKENQVVLMNSKNTIQIDNENVQIDPEVLFQRLLFIQSNRQKEDLKSIFQYELTQTPPALFDEKGFLREGNEAALSDTLWNQVGSKVSAEKITDCVYVLSGESLINQVVWVPGETFTQICNRYVEFVLRMYGKSTTVIFNAYETGPSILDEKYLRTKKGICGVEISFTGATPLKFKKQQFLNNNKNKDGFVKILTEKLRTAGCTVMNSISDANILIAQTAANKSQLTSTVVIGEETNLLVLLCFYAKPNVSGLYLKSDKKGKTKSMRIWNITETKNVLGALKSMYLLFVHAFGGCQSTSHLFGVGESKLKDKQFSAQAKKFCDHSVTKEEVIAAGEEAMVLLFKGKPGEKLNEVRFEKYKEKVATETSTVLAKRLPPTESATSYHSLRAYYQIQTWMGQTTKLNPLNYGWKQTNNHLRPILTDLPVAPANLLRAIRCGCKGNCSTLRCNCKMIGLPCTSACAQCDHVSCLNYDITQKQDDDDSDDSENDF